MSRGGSAAADPRAEADLLITRIHDYCGHRCPLREVCPGMRCRLYRQEMEARDVLQRIDEAEAWAPAIGPAGVVMEPTV